LITGILLDMGHQPENRKLDFLLAADPSPPTPPFHLSFPIVIYYPVTVGLHVVGS
jgi:hypothetical protein